MGKNRRTILGCVHPEWILACIAILALIGYLVVE